METMVIDHKTNLTNRASGVERVRLDGLRKLKDEGLLIQIDVTGPSMMTASLDWAEIGVPKGSTRMAWMTKGRKYVFSRSLAKRLNSCVVRMRQALSNLTHDIPGLRPFRYLHYRQYTRWSETWTQLTDDLAEIRDEMIAQYDAVCDQIADEYGKIAEESWKAALSAGEVAVFFDGYSFDNLDEFADAVKEKALNTMPTREDLETRISASYRVANIQGIEDIAREEARAAELAAQAQAAADHARLDAESRQQELDHQQRMMLLAEEEKRVAIQAMRQAETERIYAELDATIDPVRETFVALRRQMMQEAQEMIAAIQKNGNKVHGRTAGRALKTLSDLFEMRSIVDDRQLRERLENLKEAVGPVGEERSENDPARSTEAVLSALESIKDLVVSAREDFQDSSENRFAFLD